MIELILTYLNALLEGTNLYEKNHGLTELTTRGDTKSYREFCGGKWENIEISKWKGVSYWHKNGNVTQEQIENTVSCEKMWSWSIPLTLVSVVKNKHLEKRDIYNNEILAQTLIKTIAQTNATFKKTLKARTFKVNSDSYQTDGESIMLNEFQGSAKQDVYYDYTFITNDFTIEVEISETCLDEICDAPADFLCSTIDNANINDVAECLDALPEADKTIICDTLDCSSIGVQTRFNKAPLTNQTVIYATGDDGWHLANGTYDYVINDGDLIQRMDVFSVDPVRTLVYDNAFGTKDRFTDLSGLQLYPIISGYQIMIDHLQGLLLTSNSFGGTWANSITEANTLTSHGITGWRMINRFEMEMSAEYGSTIGDRPFIEMVKNATYPTGIWAGVLGFSFQWMSTTRNSATTAAWRYKYWGEVSSTAKTGTNDLVAVKNYNNETNLAP